MGVFKKLFNILLVLIITSLLSNFGLALVDQDIQYSVTEKNGYSSGYYNAKQSGNRAFEWRSQISNAGPGNMHVVTVAFHDDKAGSEPTIARPASGFYSSGKTDFNAGESGSMTSAFDTGDYNCGRVQLNLGFIDERYSDYHDTNFFAFLIDYGVDCAGTPTPTPTPTPAPCVAPTGLSPSSTITISGNSGYTDLAWNAVPGAVSYNVRLDDGTSYRYDDPRFQTCSNSPHYYCENEITGTRITDVPVKAGRTYSFWVDPVFSPSRNYCNGGTQFSVQKSTPSNNPPAISSCNPLSPSVTLGSTATISYSISDPEGDSFTVLVEWGDGTLPTTGGASSASHTYSSTGTFPVRVHATDSKGASTGISCSSPIKVISTPTNSPPVISTCNVPSSINLGDTATINYAVSDPDGDNVLVKIDWGDGTPVSIGGSSSSSHVYTSAGSFSVTITATDSKGAITSRQCGFIRVASSSNNPPVISSCQVSPQAILGSPTSISYSVSDPDGDNFLVTVDWGDGSTSTGGANSAAHTYTSTGTFSITITAKDSKGATTSKPCGSIIVTSGPNNPPIISSCSSPSIINLGDTATINYIVTDPDSDSFTVKIDWGDGTQSFGSSTMASHTYSFAGTFSVTITATDSRGTSTSKSCGTIKVKSTIPVNNPPIIHFCSPESPVVKLGEEARLSYSVSDPDGDSFTVKIDWGDGTFSFGTSFSASHVYSKTGTFSVTIIAKDAKGVSTSQPCGTIIVTPTAPSNKPPVISSCSPISSVVALGDSAAIIYSASDPDGDSVTVLVNWGDGNIEKGGSGSANHVYTSTGTFKVSIKAVDSKGAVTSRNCGSIIVVSAPSNNPPAISSCNPLSPSVTLGSTATISYSISDPEGDAFAVLINWGDGTTSIGGSFSASHAYSSTGTFSVTITATDFKGASATRSCGSITVTSAPSNNPPAISSCNPASSSITQGGTAAINYVISDSEGDSFGVLVNWGDGTTSSGGTSSASRTYSSTGTFSLTITATDSKGASSSRNCGSITVTSGGGGGGGGGGQPVSSARLKITSVDAKVDGKSSSNLHDGDEISKKAKPASKIEIKPKIKNLFNSTNGLKIRDIKVKTAIEGIDDGDDLTDDESNEFDLRPGGDKMVTARFELPLNVDEGTYTVSIEAEGEDTEGNEHSDSVNIDLEVKKEKHDLRFLKLELSKLKISCNETFNVNYQIINIGQEDEKKAYAEIKSEELGIDFTQKDISVKSGTTANTYTKSQQLKIANRVEDGSYTLTGNIFTDDEKLTDTKTVQLNVQGCGKEEKAKEEKTPTYNTPTTTQITGTQTTKTVYQIPFIDIFRGGTNFGLLIITTFILSIFFLIVAIVLLVREDYEE